MGQKRNIHKWKENKADFLNMPYAKPHHLADNLINNPENTSNTIKIKTIQTQKQVFLTRSMPVNPTPQKSLESNDISFHNLLNLFLFKFHNYECFEIAHCYQK